MEVVAVGAAIQAGVLKGRLRMYCCGCYSLTWVSKHWVGVATALINRNRLPTSKHRFSVLRQTTSQR
jgi:molecular chaperone DnaK (HSP70)